MGRKALKTAGIVLVSLTGLLLVALLGLYYLAEPLVERYLIKQVARHTEGLYKIDITELQLNPLTSSITLHGLHFYPDPARHRLHRENEQPGHSFFDVQSPELKLTGINLADLLFNNRLTIGSIAAERPVITHLLDETVENNTGGKIKRGSNSSMEAVRIRKFDIQQASYRCLVLGEPNRPRQEIPHLSLQVQNLRLDLQGQQDISSMLQADATQLDISNYAYHSPDSVYAIRVGRFSYSSRQQELKAEGVKVQPDLQANAALHKDRAYRFVYQLSTPLLYLKGLDVAATWHTKQLQLDCILLDRTSLHILEDFTVPDATSFPELPDLYARLSPYLREIGVRELRLTDGSFSYRQKTGAVYTVHRLDKANINLQALQLDSASLFTPKEKAFAAEISLTSENYTYSPRNSPYTLKTGSIELSTRDKTLQANALHLTGDWGKNDSLKSLNKAKRTFYNLVLPRLRFCDLDLLRALRTSRLAIGSIAAAHPVIDVRTDPLVQMPDGPDLQQLYRKISGLVSSLEVGEISITDAALTQHRKTKAIQRLQQLEHASLTATGLQVDSAFIFHPDKKLPLQHVVVTARNYRYRMPDNTYTFALDGLRYSTRQGEFTARSVNVISSIRANDRQKFFNNASRKLFDLSASMLRVTGLDLIKALNTGRLEADLVLLRQPKVAILLNRKVAATAPGQQDAGKRLFGLLDIVSMNTIRLEDGSLTFNEKLEPVMRTHLLEHATATASGFQLTPAGFANLGEALPMREMTLRAKDYTYRSTDSLYIIRLDSLHYSSRQQELVARTFSVSADRAVNERLKAENPNLASRNLIDISAKRSLITGFNLIHAYATGQYHINRLLLAGPQVTILQDHNVLPAKPTPPAGQDTTATSSATKQLTDLATTFQVQRLQVTDGTFDFHILEDTIRKSQTLAHVTLGIDRLRLVSLEATDPLDIFDADDISIRIQGYTFYPRDSLYAVEVKEISASKRNRSLLIDSLRLRPLFSKEEYVVMFTYARDRIDLIVPGIDMQGISLRALFNNQDLVAQKMLIQNPKVEIYRDNRLGIDPKLRLPTLQRSLREAGLYIRLDTILVEKNNIVHHLIAIDGIKSGLLLMENIRMELYNVTNDSALIRRNNMITVNASAQLMGASTLQARFRFQLDHPEDRYTYEGSLEPMDFAALNPLIENIMFIRIKSGWINEASFSIASTKHLATGQVHLSYKNLKVQLLNKHDPANPGFLLKAGSRLVNTLVIKSNNPSARGNFRQGDVSEKRDPQQSVYYHMGQAILNGVTSSLMIKMVKRIVTNFVDL